MRKLLPTWLIAALGISVIAAPCTTTGPAQRNFEAGSLVIPMDDCYQRATPAWTPSGTCNPACPSGRTCVHGKCQPNWAPDQTTACDSTADGGVFRAYGLVYYLLKHNVNVYWAIDGATPKTSVTAFDVAARQAAELVDVRVR
jgi:hypothetical protein